MTAADRSAGPTSIRERVLWPLVFTLLLGWSVRMQRGGYLHYEGQFFLVNYLDGRRFLEKVFSARKNDWDCFQARELAYVFDWLDAQLVVAGVQLGMPHLYSITTYFGLFVIAILCWRALTRFATPIGSTTAGLLVALFLSSPVGSLSGFYFRSSKVLTALLLVLCVRELLSALARESDEPPGHEHRQAAALRLFILASLMTLADRQGFYLTLALGVVTAVRAFALLDRRTWSLVGALALAAALNVAYNLYLGRALIRRFEGVWPSLFAQRVRVLDVFSERWHYTSAVKVLRDQLDFLFGNWHPAMGFLLGAVITVGYWLRRAHPARTLGMVSTTATTIADFRTAPRLLAALRARLPFVLFGVGAALVGVMVMLMLYKLPSILWPESRRVYYWIPLSVVILLAAGFSVAGYVERFPSRRARIPALLAAMVATNLLALPRHQALIRAREQREQIAEAPRLRECFVGARPVRGYGLRAPAAHACAVVRARAVAAPITSETPPGTPLPALYCRSRART